MVAGSTLLLSLTACEPKVNRYDLARQMVTRINDPQERAEMQAKLAGSLVRAGHYEEALEVIDQIGDSWEVTARVSWALAAFNNGKIRPAKRELAKAQADFKELSEFRRDIAERMLKQAEAVIFGQADALGTALAGHDLAQTKFNPDHPEEALQYLKNAENSGDLSAMQSAVGGYLLLARKLGPEHETARAAVKAAQGKMPLLPGMIQLDLLQQYMALMRDWGEMEMWQSEMKRLEDEFLAADRNVYPAFRIRLLMASEAYGANDVEAAKRYIQEASSLAEKMHVADESAPFLQIGRVMHLGGDPEAESCFAKAVDHAFGQPGFFKPVSLAVICMQIAEENIPVPADLMERIREFARSGDADQ
jgi:tetratricopeptide (TPR) repeat protein